MLNSSLIYKLYYDWWKNIDKSILLLIILLFSLGLFFSLVSTSLIASDKLDTNSYYFFFKHLFYIGIAIFFVIFFSSINQANLFRPSIVLFIICFIDSRILSTKLNLIIINRTISSYFIIYFIII